MSDTLSARGRLGAAKRFNPEAVEEAERDLGYAKLEQYIRRVVAEAPPLTPTQRDRLAAMLREPEHQNTLRRRRGVDERIAGGGVE